MRLGQQPCHVLLAKADRYGLKESRMKRKSGKTGHRACGHEGLYKWNSFQFVRSHFKGLEEDEAMKGEAMKNGTRQE